MGAWPLAVMLFLGSGYWAARGAFSAGTARGRHVLGARVALTLAVPVTVAAVIGQGPGRDEASAFALLLALVCQQLLTAALQRSGVAAFAPQTTFGAFGSAAALVLIGLPFLEAAPGHTLTAVALMVQLLVAFGVGAMMLPRPAAEKDWSATAWEAVPLALSVIAVAVAFQSVVADCRKRGVALRGGLFGDHRHAPAAAPAPLDLLVVRPGGSNGPHPDGL